MRLTITHLSTCTPDYFQGHAGAYLQISVDPKMSITEVRRRMCEVVRQGDIQGDDKIAFLLRADFVGTENEKAANEATSAVYSAIARVKGSRPRQRVVEFFDASDDSVETYAYFSISEGV